MKNQAVVITVYTQKNNNIWISVMLSLSFIHSGIIPVGEHLMCTEQWLHAQHGSLQQEAKKTLLSRNSKGKQGRGSVVLSGILALELHAKR